mmetsp:Transcript_12383/g.17656  ORF Transcript_12383/g.17656 Transcript_12383/m.17656 type:complete len:202 (+) Transcript_12383:1536-2141(+)
MVTKLQHHFNLLMEQNPTLEVFFQCLATVKTIVVGKDDETDGLLFFNPHTNDVLSSSDYCLDPSKPSGSVFHFHSKHPNQFYKLDTEDSKLAPPEFDQGELVIIKDNTQQDLMYKQAYIISIPLSAKDHYTVQVVDSNNILQCPASKILKLPTTDKTETIPQTPPWISHEAPCTLFLKSGMSTSCQGYLLFKDNKWTFKPG